MQHLACPCSTRSALFAGSAVALDGIVTSITFASFSSSAEPLAEKISSSVMAWVPEGWLPAERVEVLI